jgi:diguanylate cyclase (GGDEF)-like protein/PAS domain S-box-containing protein
MRDFRPKLAMAAMLLASGLLLGAYHLHTQMSAVLLSAALVLTLGAWTLLALFIRGSKRHDLGREQLLMAQEVGNDGTWEWEVGANRVSFSPRRCESLGYTPEEMGSSWDVWTRLIHPDDRSRMTQALDSHLQGHTPVYQCELRLRTRAGGYRWTLSRARIVTRDASGGASRVLGVDVDLTAARQHSARGAHQESHDALTGLANRQEFERRLQELLDQRGQQRAEHTLCHVDLDRFQVINETCGPAAGDELLCEFAGLLKNRLRHRDTLARIGGDEFGILMQDCSVVHAEHVARALLETIEELRFNWRGESYSIGASIGLVAVSDEHETIAEILGAVDAACHAAKERGGHRIQVFSADDSRLARRQSHMQWVSRVSRALDDDRFCLSFQPIAPISPQDGNGLHYELLLRLREEDGTLVSPAAFLPAAELYSLSTKLDRWVVGWALEWLNRNPRHVDDLELCTINLSGHSLGDDEFLSFVVNRFANSRVPTEKICFEITETAAIENLEHASRFMNTLRDLGARFALDDFGSGLSSFAYLRTLPVEFLKIDGLFVKNIVTDPIHLAMVRSINEVGHVMGMKTVAEFVENSQILELLRDVGVDYAQGYAICAPRPLEVFERESRTRGGAHGAPSVSAA